MDAHLPSVFEHETKHNDAIVSLLSETTIGTNGAVYRHLHTANKINDLYKPHFFTLYRRQKAVANITICERPMLVDSQLLETFYVRYFAFASSFQTKQRGQTKQKSNILSEYTTQLLNTSNLNINEPQFNSKIFWAIIDPENDRSLQMGERFGFKTIAKIKTVAFSRIKPAHIPSVTRLAKHEQKSVLTLIQQFYEGYNSRSTVHLFKHGHFFVLKDKGKIVAGIQVNPAAWKIEALPGLFGKLLVKVLPYTPFINRIVNPKRHHFLAAEGLFWKEGCENEVEKLLEGTLHLQNCHSMLLWTDAKDKRLLDTLKNTKLGWLQQLKADNEVNLMAKFNHVPASVESSMRDQLHYISGFDCT